MECARWPMDYEVWQCLCGWFSSDALPRAWPRNWGSWTKSRGPGRESCMQAALWLRFPFLQMWVFPLRSWLFQQRPSLYHYCLRSSCIFFSPLKKQYFSFYLSQVNILADAPKTHTSWTFICNVKPSNITTESSYRKFFFVSFLSYRSEKSG